MSVEASQSPRRGRLFVISAPSGAGKTSLVSALLAGRPELRLSISHTTRRARETERDGREYYFVAPEIFQKSIEQGAFLEHAHVFGNHYGTARGPVERELDAGHDVVLEIDWQGARQVRAALPGAVMVFILPPNRAALETRLRSRKTDSDQVITRRLSEAVGDMSHADEFDYVIVNDDFERAAGELQMIVDGRGEQLGASRKAIQELLRSME